jgi:hypothetical protein
MPISSFSMTYADKTALLEDTIDNMDELARHAFRLRKELKMHLAQRRDPHSLPDDIIAIEKAISRAFHLAEDAKAVHMDLLKLSDQYRIQFPPVPTEKDAVSEVKQRLDNVDDQLRALEKRIVSLNAAQTVQVKAERLEHGNDMADYEIDFKLDYVLAEDDPAYAEDDDNILTTREGLIMDYSRSTTDEDGFDIDTVDWPPASPLFSRQGWYVHELLDHDYGAGRRRLKPLELLRIGKVWIDVVTTRQYCLNLRTGQYEIWGAESCQQDGSSGEP